MLPYNAFAFKEDRSIGCGDLCILHTARAHIMSHTDFYSLSSKQPPIKSVEELDTAALPPLDAMQSLYESSNKVMCVELVGDRFLRRMVRILVVCYTLTAIAYLL